MLPVLFTKLLQSYQCTPIIQPTPFGNLNHACTALAILIFKELLYLVMTNKGIHKVRTDISQKASRELLGLQDQLTSVVRVQCR